MDLKFDRESFKKQPVIYSILFISIFGPNVLLYQFTDILPNAKHPEYYFLGVLLILSLAIGVISRRVKDPILINENEKDIIKFKSKKEWSDYFKERLLDVDFVEDFTWAKISHKSSKNNSDYEYVNRIKEVASNSTEYYELFIFSHKGNYRQDRLDKLKQHYEEAIKRQDYSYSCAFYEETEFPRLQFTLLGGEEVMFTSSHNTRCSIKDKLLASIFSQYFEEAWDGATVLIDSGKIVGNDKLQALLKESHLESEDS
jgi:hypothetical protein